MVGSESGRTPEPGPGGPGVPRGWRPLGEPPRLGEIIPWRLLAAAAVVIAAVTVYLWLFHLGPADVPALEDLEAVTKEEMDLYVAVSLKYCTPEGWQFFDAGVPVDAGALARTLRALDGSLSGRVLSARRAGSVSHRVRGLAGRIGLVQSLHRALVERAIANGNTFDRDMEKPWLSVGQALRTLRGEAGQLLKEAGAGG